MSVAFLGLLSTALLGAPEVFTHTRHVEDLHAHGTSLWVATSGGLEEYPEHGRGPRRWFGIADGLDHMHVVRVDSSASGLRVETRTGTCERAGDRFACVPRAEAWQPPRTVAPRLAGARVTERLEVDGEVFVATAGAGVWVEGSEPRLITPEDQICSNHAMALQVHRGALFIGTFDEGLCVFREGTFQTIDAPFRMVNDLATHGDALWVAANEGLFHTRDGVTFERLEGVRARGVNGLAVADGTLFVTAPAVLYAVDGDRVRGTWMPGGSRSLQKVRAAGDVLWLASEDRGALRRGADASIAVFDRLIGTPSSWVLDVSPGPAGVVFAGTLRDGVFALSEDGSIERVLESAWVLDVLWHEDALWVGTQDGAYRVQDGVAVRLGGLPDRNVHRILPTAEGLWVATEGGLARYPDPI